MRKAKSTLLVVACLVLVLVASVPAVAATKGAVLRCLQCNQGNISETTTRKYEHDESFPCKHGLEGYDLYAVYEVVTLKECSYCTYRSEYVNHVHEFVACQGY